MLDPLHDLRSAATSMLSRYATRALVAVPFLIAAGFATAAVTLTLVERFGPGLAYVMLAGAFSIAGMLVSLATQEHGLASRVLATLPRSAMRTTSGFLNLVLVALLGLGIALHAWRASHPFGTGDQTVFVPAAAPK
jgi:hypothetical protein